MSGHLSSGTLCFHPCVDVIWSGGRCGQTFSFSLDPSSSSEPLRTVKGCRDPRGHDGRRSFCPAAVFSLHRLWFSLLSVSQRTFSFQTKPTLFVFILRMMKNTESQSDLLPCPVDTHTHTVWMFMHVMVLIIRRSQSDFSTAVSVLDQIDSFESICSDLRFTLISVRFGVL